jgi:hypothetical protein
VKEKTRIVPIGEARYQIGRFNPEVGSYILKSLVMSLISGDREQSSAAVSDLPPSVAAAEAPSGEDSARPLIFAAFLKQLDFNMHKFISRQCMAVVACMNGDAPMPIANGAGVLVPEVRDDLSLVMRLEIETLMLNFSDFFVHGGLAGMAGTTPASQK